MTEINKQALEAFLADLSEEERAAIERKLSDVETHQEMNREEKFTIDIVTDWVGNAFGTVLMELQQGTNLTLESPEVQRAISIKHVEETLHEQSGTGKTFAQELADGIDPQAYDFLLHTMQQVRTIFETKKTQQEKKEAIEALFDKIKNIRRLEDLETLPLAA